MTANHSRNVLDLIESLKSRVADLEATRVLGAQAAVCTSTTHPANPAPGRMILETDTGLHAMWNGSAWQYPPQQIAKVVVGTATSSVRIPASGSIPQNFTNLRLVISGRSDGTTAVGYDSASMRFNGSTSGYNWNSYFAAQGAASVSTASATGQSAMQCAEIWNAHFGTPARGYVVLDIPNYSDTSGIKGFVASSAGVSDSGSAGLLQTYTGFWSGTPRAITSIDLLMSVGNWTSDSTFTLYGS